MDIFIAFIFSDQTASINVYNLKKTVKAGNGKITLF